MNKYYEIYLLRNFKSEILVKKKAFTMIAPG